MWSLEAIARPTFLRTKGIARRVLLLGTWSGRFFGEGRKPDLFVGMGLAGVGVAFDGKDGDLTSLRAIGPKHAAGSRRVVFQVGFKNFVSELFRQGGDFVGIQARMLWILGQQLDGFDPLCEKGILLRAEAIVLFPGKELVSKLQNLGLPHMDGEGHSR